MIKFNETTWYSKLGAAIFFLGIFPTWTFYIGILFQQTIDMSEIEQVVNDQKIIPRNPALVATSTSEAVTTAQLSIGDSVKVKGIQITLEDIVQDSRCPIDVQCIQAGDVIVRVQFKTEDSTGTVNLESDKKHAFGAYTISIAQINPDPISTRTLELDDYRVTFIVVK